MKLMKNYMELKVIILLKILRKDLDYILQILHLTYKKKIDNKKINNDFTLKNFNNPLEIKSR